MNYRLQAIKKRQEYLKHRSDRAKIARLLGDDPGKVKAGFNGSPLDEAIQQGQDLAMNLTGTLGMPEQFTYR